MTMQSTQSPLTLISGVQSEAIGNERDVDASLLLSSAHLPERDAARRETDDAAPDAGAGWVKPSRRRMATEARASTWLSKVGAEGRAAEASDAEDTLAVVSSTVDAKSATSSGQRFDRLVQQVQARPQIAIGVVAAAGIIVTTLVWTKVGRVMLLAASGIVADRLYGSRLRRTVKRMASRLPAKLAR